jgi:putative methionine-R-sulfoxide reductase with GAF domain
MSTVKYLVEGDRADLMSTLSGLKFDQAIFFEHASDDAQGLNQNLSCPRFVIDGEGRPLSWPQRWQREWPGTDDWIHSDTPWIDDLEAIIDNPVAGASLRVGDLIGVQMLRRSGIRGLLATAIFEDGRILASLVIGSKQAAAYREQDRDVLRGAEIAAVMHKLIESLQERRQKLLRDIRRKFEPELSPDKLAAEIVELLAGENGWDSVGIYRVENQFALVASCDRTEGRVLKMDPNYRQNLDVGMLGQTLKRGECLRADDVTTDPPPFNYKTNVGFDAKSALCYPIFVGGKIEWILDCASVAFAAFRGPDREMLDELINGLQSTLNLWFETRLSKAILDGLSEAVIVTDREGTIQRVNTAACALFGLGKEMLPHPLLDLAADEETRKKFKPVRPLQNDDVTLMTAMQQPRALLVTAALSSEAFGQYVLKFTAKGEKEWLAGLEHARSTVQTEVGQARVLLMLASALVGRVRADLKTARPAKEIDDKLQRAAEAIAQADLSYDRLVGALAGKTKRGVDTLALHTLVDWAAAALPNLPSMSGEKGGSAAGKRLLGALTTVAREFIGSTGETPDSASTPDASSGASASRQIGASRREEEA